MPQTFTRQGSFSGTTPVLLHARPDSGSLLVRELFIHNLDSTYVTVRLYASSTTDINVWKGTLDPGDTLCLAHHDIIVLNTSTDLYAVLDADPSTTQPTWKVGLAVDTTS